MALGHRARALIDQVKDLAERDHRAENHDQHRGIASRIKSFEKIEQPHNPPVQPRGFLRLDFNSPIDMEAFPSRAKDVGYWLGIKATNRRRQIARVATTANAKAMPTNSALILARTPAAYLSARPNPTRLDPGSLPSPPPRKIGTLGNNSERLLDESARAFTFPPSINPRKYRCRTA